MIDKDVKIGKNVRIHNKQQVNIFGCCIGDDVFIGPFVEITRGVEIGPRCKIESHAFICDGVAIGTDVFVGHGVVFTNDLYPTCLRQVVKLKCKVENYASIGSNSTIIGGIRIGEYSVIGAGSVVTKDVPPYSIFAGNPATLIRSFPDKKSIFAYFEKRQKTEGPLSGI